MRWTPWRHRHTTRAIGPAAEAETPLEHPVPESPTPAVTLQVVADAPLHCRVAVLGSSGGLRTLPGHLPASWTVDFLDEVGDLTVADLVVLAQPTAGKIASVQVRQPEASILALAHASARVDTVVDLLAHGASACVRSTDPALVAAHLVACARRYAVPVG